MSSTEVMFKLPLSLIPFFQTPLPCPAPGGALSKQRLDCGARGLRKINVLWTQRHVGSNPHPLTICNDLEKAALVLWTPLPYLEIRKNNVSQDGTDYKIRQFRICKSPALRRSIINTSPFFCGEQWVRVQLSLLPLTSCMIFTSCLNSLKSPFSDMYVVNHHRWG